MTGKPGDAHTGDRGYLAEGQLAVCDRLKDLVILMGRNISPAEIEQAAARVTGVRAGNVVAFSVPGRPHERLVVVAETRGGAVASIRDEIANAVRDQVDILPADVVVVGPGSLPKTSSGKLQRSLCRQHYLDGGVDL